MKTGIAALLKCAAIFLLILVIASAVGAGLLAAASLLPQKAVTSRLEQSLEQLTYEGNYPHVYDKNASSNQLDNFSEAIILSESYYLDKSWRAVWENPFYNTEPSDPTGALALSVTSGETANRTYSRYWGGFRVYCRALLCFFNYTQIRTVLSFCFFALLSAAAYTFLKHGGVLSAAVFTGGIILIKPWIVCSSMQFSCCFILAFVFVTVAPYFFKKGVPAVYFFFAAACVTQFFDFYTTPTVTFGLPMCLYLVINRGQGASRNFAGFIKSFAAWIAGYILMWLSKLSLTCIFTAENAFSEAFSAVERRIGSEKIPGREDTYNALKAVKEAAKAMFTSKKFLVLTLLLFVLLIIVCIVKRTRLAPGGRNIPLAARLPEASVFLAAAAIPFLWFAVAASPTVIHSFFQYRTAVTVPIAAGLFIESLLCSETAQPGKTGARISLK